MSGPKPAWGNTISGVRSSTSVRFAAYSFKRRALDPDFNESQVRRDWHGRFAHQYGGARAGLEKLTDAGEIVDEQAPGSGQMALTRIVTYKDGSKALSKVMKPHKLGDAKRQVDRETLASLVGEAVGVRVPAVHRVSDNKILTEFFDDAIDGYEAEKLYPDIDRSPAGLKVALLDVLSYNTDRHPGNWLVRQGQLIPIDHGVAFDAVDYYPDNMQPPRNSDGDATIVPLIGFAQHRLVTYGEFGMRDGKWMDNPFNREDLDDLRGRLEALEPQFKALGRGGWYRSMMRRWQSVYDHAQGEHRGLLDAGPDELAPITL